MLEAERNRPLGLPELSVVRDRLNRLKTEALDEFARSDFAGKDLLFGFLAQVNDVRDYVRRLILESQERNGKANAS